MYCERDYQFLTLILDISVAGSVVKSYNRVKGKDYLHYSVTHIYKYLKTCSSKCIGCTGVITILIHYHAIFVIEFMLMNILLEHDIILFDSQRHELLNNDTNKYSSIVALPFI